MDAVNYPNLQKLFSFDDDWKDNSEVLHASSLDDLDDADTDTNVFVDTSSG